jgi:hypothetical protein
VGFIYNTGSLRDGDLKNRLCKINGDCGSIHQGFLLLVKGFRLVLFADLLEESILSLAADGTLPVTPAAGHQSRQENPRLKRRMARTLRYGG